MHIALTEEQTMIQDMAQKFAESELAPVAAELDQSKDLALFKTNLAKLAELGFMGLNVKSEYGGVEAGSVAFSLAITELAKACASTAVTTSVTNMVAEVIQAVGNEQQKQTYLPKFCNGEYLAGGFCLTESGAGSDPSAMKTTAVKDGDEYVLNGSKIYITSGEIAGCFVVWAVTDATARKGKGISCFIVDAGTPGMTIGKREHKMGQHASPTNEVHFDQCRIPVSALLGEENKGFAIAVGELAGGRIGIGSLALGIGLAALDYAKQYCQDRQQFGQSISQFQGPQWMLAERYTDMEAARLLLMQAAFLKDQGQAFATSASMAKLFAADKANKAVYDALQLLGGAGYIQEYPLERMARDVRITSIYEGTSEIQKLIIARDIFA
ncbi:acyl-CoA dehydrogenase family protein [Thalassotalea ponticola]|uniref:acyl-CoA dehydrogenase family protein n=1 Tax=Thalassotalea ponticola TaxID=1523392 RepID=UPI0025B417FE|nr:acyl-CoA dehydrogenase family protein [Thalassotalea ponticola]MDN3651634.1 acyl-CoA dehydrogenase family protein [Thalassotalea ponticola]